MTSFRAQRERDRRSPKGRVSYVRHGSRVGARRIAEGEAMKLTGQCISVALMLWPVVGQSTPDNLAFQLGTILGSEGFCSLSYDQGSLRAFIEKQVAADDLDFAGNLEMMADGTRLENKQMGPSEKTARCTQVERSARAYGFIK